MNSKSKENPELFFHIETRAGIPVLVEKSGGCHIATMYELALWEALAKTKNLLSEKRKTGVSKDAYVGAREDLQMWKNRALKAEALNREFYQMQPTAWGVYDPECDCWLFTAETRDMAYDRIKEAAIDPELAVVSRTWVVRPFYAAHEKAKTLQERRA